MLICVTQLWSNACGQA